MFSARGATLSTFAPAAANSNLKKAASSMRKMPPELFAFAITGS